ncbi:PD-(D/E)XK nuclease family protein [Nostoc sp.]|uniref:PD-(D/E)XK nuclease family protein n=1 Tax=Nostoc sp. TaxID=1180 RepID=UPI002FF65CA6
MQFDTQLLPRINSKSLRENGKQYYVDAKGNRLPSVTTILNITKPQADRDRLLNWKARVGTEEATRISTNASRRGTQTHKQIERYLLGQNPVCPEASRPYWESIKPVLEEIDTVRLVEGSVFHYDLSYSGKVDCIASYQGIPCICEWKTADKPKGSIEHLYEYPLQLTAYIGAINNYYQHDGIQLNHALLVVAIPEMPAEVFWFEPAAIKDYWQQWEKRVAEYWERRSVWS